MKKSLIIVLTIGLAFSVLAEKLAVLYELNKPGFDIVISENQLFISEGPTVFIYSLADGKLLKSFGRRGEGPGEFKLGSDEEVYLVPHGDRLFIESGDRFSIFTREGSFVREMKIPFRSDYTLLQPLGQQFIGFKNEVDKETEDFYKVLCVFDEDLHFLREICRDRHIYQRKGMTVLQGTFLFKVSQAGIFVTYWGGDFVLDCFDRAGNRRFTIKEEGFEKRKVVQRDIDRIYTYFKTYHEAWYTRNRDRLFISEFWPAIGTFFLDHHFIYIVTYIPRNEDVREYWLVYIYNQQGRFIRKVYLPLKEENVWSTYPHTFYDKKLYQLIENEDTEEWELHVTAVDTGG